jgi:hypothetical protein
LSIGIIVSGSYFLLYLYFRKQAQRTPILAPALVVILFLGSAALTQLIGGESATQRPTAASHLDARSAAQTRTDMDLRTDHAEHHDKHQPALKPAEGASVKILSPKPGQLFESDQIPVQFKLIKGKKGHHVHAYVDEELMGMFESESGTLTGIKSGKHKLELRVVTRDHNTELDATDQVDFTVK